MTVNYVSSATGRIPPMALKIILLFLSPIAQQPLVCQGLLIIEASRSHSDTPQSVGLLWTGY